MEALRDIRWQGRFFRRVFSVLALLLSVGMVLVSALTWRLMENWLLEYTQDQMTKQVILAEELTSAKWPYSSLESAQADCVSIHERTGLRATLIGTDGRVLGDSDGNPAEMENHAGRAEVMAALAGRVGHDRRTSASVHRPFLYTAMPLKRDGEVVGVIRIAAPVEDFVRRETAMVRWIGLGLAVALPLSLILAWFLVRSIAKPVGRVSAWARQLATGDLTTRVEVGQNDEIGQVATALDRMRELLASRIREADQQREDLEVTLASLEEGVIAVDHGGTVLFSNPAARRLLGVGDEFARSQLTEQYGARSLGRLWREAAASGVVEIQREVSLSGADGDRSVMVDVLRVSAETTPIAWLLCLRDVTALARSAAMKADFVANASHELRTPLAAIRAALETVREEAVDSKIRERFMGVIERNVYRLQDLTEDLMHLNRVESERVELNPTEFAPSELFASMQAGYGEALAAKRGRMSFESSVGKITTDRRILELVLKNLVDNSVKFVGEDGRIELSCEDVGGMARFEVRDNGCGIPEEDQPRVFERFYQVDKSRGGAARGTGLGLAIVKHAVSAMGGRVWLTSDVGVGTSVFVEIPIAAAEGESGEAVMTGAAR